MKVTAALVWYDEDPTMLYRAVTSACTVADRVVAVDGAYRRFPDGRPASPAEQAYAIRAAAADAGRESLVVVPGQLWAGGVEKRTHLFGLASVGADWLLLLDADWVIHADGDRVRSHLAAVPPDMVAAEVPLQTPINPDRTMYDSAAGMWHANTAGTTEWYRVLIRALPGLRAEQKHWWYSGLLDGRRVWVMTDADDNRYHQPKPYHVGDGVFVEHRCLFRDSRTILANRAFCNDREMVVELTGQEDDVPGLPAPVFDYSRRPG